MGFGRFDRNPFKLIYSLHTKYSNRAVKYRLSNRTVTSRYSISYGSFIRNNALARLVGRKKGIVKVDDFFCSQFLAEVNLYTLQQNRYPPSKNPRPTTVPNLNISPILYLPFADLILSWFPETPTCYWNSYHIWLQKSIRILLRHNIV